MSAEPLPDHVPTTRRTWLLPYLIAGVACVIGGGLLAAATAYVTTEKTAWATAYIVLIGGVAQVVLGVAVAWLSPLASRRFAWLSWFGWNLGNAGVVAGQLTGFIALTDVGTALLVVALVLVLLAVRSGQRVGTQGLEVQLGPPHRGVLLAFRVIIVILTVSMIVGVTLAYVT